MTRTLTTYLIVGVLLLHATNAYCQERLWSVADNAYSARFSTNGQRIAVEYGKNDSPSRFDSVVACNAATGERIVSILTLQRPIIGSAFAEGDSVLAIVWLDTLDVAHRLDIERVSLISGRRTPVASIDVRDRRVTPSTISISSNGLGSVAIGLRNIDDSTGLRQLHIVEMNTGLVTPIPTTGFDKVSLRNDTLSVLSYVRDSSWGSATPYLTWLRLPTNDTIRRWRFDVGGINAADGALRSDGRLLLAGAYAFDIRDSVVRDAQQILNAGTIIGASGWVLHYAVRARPQENLVLQYGYDLRDMHGVSNLSWFLPIEKANRIFRFAISSPLLDSSRFAFIANGLYRIPPLPPVPDHAIAVSAQTPVLPCARFTCRSFAHVTRAVSSYEWSIDGGPWVRTAILDTAVDRPTPYLVRLRTTYADGSSDTLVRALAHPYADTNIVAVACDESIPFRDTVAMTYHAAAALLIYNGIAPEVRPTYYRTTPPTIRRTSHYDDLDALTAWAPDGQPYLFTLHENPQRSTPVYYVASIIRRDIHTANVIDTVCNVKLGRPSAYSAVVAHDHHCYYAPGRRRLILNMRFTFLDTISDPGVRQIQTRMIRIDPERGRYVSRTPELRGSTNWSTFVQLDENHDIGVSPIQVLDLDDAGSTRLIHRRSNDSYVDDETGIRVLYGANGTGDVWTYRVSDGSLIRRISTLTWAHVRWVPRTAQSARAFWLSESVMEWLQGGAKHLGPFVDLEADSIVFAFGMFYKDGPASHMARSVDGSSVFVGSGGTRYVFRIPNAAAVKLRLDPVSVIDEEPLPTQLSWLPRRSLATSADRIALDVPTDTPWTIRCIDLRGRTMFDKVQNPTDGELDLHLEQLPTGTFAIQYTDGHNTATLLLQRIDTTQP